MDLKRPESGRILGAITPVATPVGSSISNNVIRGTAAVTTDLVQAPSVQWGKTTARSVSPLAMPVGRSVGFVSSAAIGIRRATSLTPGVSGMLYQHAKIPPLFRDSPSPAGPTPYVQYEGEIVSEPGETTEIDLPFGPPGTIRGKSGIIRARPDIAPADQGIVYIRRLMIGQFHYGEMTVQIFVREATGRFALLVANPPHPPPGFRSTGASSRLQGKLAVWWAFIPMSAFNEDPASCVCDFIETNPRSEMGTRGMQFPVPIHSRPLIPVWAGFRGTSVASPVIQLPVPSDQHRLYSAAYPYPPYDRPWSLASRGVGGYSYASAYGYSVGTRNPGLRHQATSHWVRGPGPLRLPNLGTEVCMVAGIDAQTGYAETRVSVDSSLLDTTLTTNVDAYFNCVELGR